MFNLMALTGRKSRLERQLHALEQGAAEGAGAEAQALQERIGVQDRLAEIEERMKDWETEVSSKGAIPRIWICRGGRSAHTGVARSAKPPPNFSIEMYRTRSAGTITSDS